MNCDPCVTLTNPFESSVTWPPGKVYFKKYFFYHPFAEYGVAKDLCFVISFTEQKKVFKNILKIFIPRPI